MKSFRLFCCCFLCCIFYCWGHSSFDMGEATLDMWKEFESNYTISQQVNSSGIRAPLTEEQKLAMIRFFIYSDRRDTSHTQEIVELQNLQSLTSSSFFRSDWPLKIFIHGFTFGSNCSFPQELKDTYLSQGFQCNLLVIDWGPLAMTNDPLLMTEKFENYYEATSNVPLVGRRVGDFITHLWLDGSYSPSQVHIIGFSLGAHVAGQAGLQVYKNIQQKVGRITGLDPAGPLFVTGAVGRHLISTDASYVDFVHTDMGQSGTLYSLGHANFFINGGKPKQPGCLSTLAQTTSIVQLIPVAILGSCSHSKAPLYYEESLTRRQILARQCHSYRAFKAGLCSQNGLTVFGEFSSPATRGDYYLQLPERNPMEVHKC